MNSYNDVKIREIRKLAGVNAWVEIDHQQNIGMLSFTNAIDRINIYYTKMTVATCVNHPKKGKTQLFRRRVDFGTLEKIFQNPRVHLGIGYYKAGEKQGDQKQ